MTHSTVFVDILVISTLVFRSGVFELNRFEINSQDFCSAAETDPAPGVVGIGAEWHTYIYKNRPTARGRESNIKISQKKVVFFRRFLQKCNSEARRRRPAYVVVRSAADRRQIPPKRGAECVRPFRA